MRNNLADGRHFGMERWITMQGDVRGVFSRCLIPSESSQLGLIGLETLPPDCSYSLETFKDIKRLFQLP